MFAAAAALTDTILRITETNDCSGQGYEREANMDGVSPGAKMKLAISPSALSERVTGTNEISR